MGEPVLQLEVQWDYSLPKVLVVLLGRWDPYYLAIHAHESLDLLSDSPVGIRIEVGIRRVVHVVTIHRVHQPDVAALNQIVNLALGCVFRFA